mmetsp:Transcript_1108/g.1812  ORF Transcript_1108/g.1812 Transcript_1108/m.1812 type:complete len:406 (+) Transcript_1108:1879-3096(+)|eukprot:CAMPEP_0203769354 /NCGR_PEP_ID=MMETSP0099_2-20121227/2138_1 /ASSEMBLY_ACC=CAM_ASM_000209 /TAXON_ID=96639 /ORGANISM=" , Strain NY0313808BC1" /LENGTH=405 /DNA_ID=CAMNT_0050666229 /DNA_START=2276 /DNA_END=3493 /DNA_ORIENTATION=+
MEDYKDFVKSHPQQVKRMEEMGRLVTMLLPVSKFGKFSEVFQESTYSILGLVSLYHDRIIQGATHVVSGMPNSGDKYTRMLRLCVTLFSHTEVVIEMLGGIFGGPKARLLVIYVIECVKALMRLVLLAQTRAGQVLVSGGQILSIKPNDVQPQEQDADGIEQGTDGNETSSEEKIVELKEGSIPVQTVARWCGKRSGKTLVLPESLKSFDNMESADPKLETGKGSSRMEPRATGDGPGAIKSFPGPEDFYLRMAGEVVHIIRPVIYIAHVRRTAGKKSWSPFLVSLLLEAFSLRCTCVATSGADVSMASGVSTEELLSRAVKKFFTTASTAGPREKRTSDEIDRRKMLFALYLMRTPVFDKVTLPAVEKFAGGLGGLPGVGATLNSMIVETLMYYHRNFFYISGS